MNRKEGAFVVAQTAIVIAVLTALALPLSSLQVPELSSSGNSQIGALNTMVESIPPETCGNCTFHVPWSELITVFPSLSDLESASIDVVVANVTSAWTVSRGGVPVTLYNITVISPLKESAIPTRPIETWNQILPLL